MNKTERHRIKFELEQTERRQRSYYTDEQAGIIKALKWVLDFD